VTEIVAVDEQAVHATDLQRASLVDLLDRLIGNGVVLSGDIVISLAGVDLVLLRLRALLTTVREAEGIRS
jgi:hypothetical protein